MRWWFSSIVLGALVCHPLAVTAQKLDAEGQVREAVLAKYHVTQAAADNSDIVTAGDVITLQKTGMIMFPTTVTMHTVAYHDGKFSAGGFTAFAALSGNLSAGTQSRRFVAGEKCWLTAVDIKEDGLYLSLLSDPINSVRYMGILKFPVDKKQPMPAADLMVGRVAEVMSAAPLDGAPAAAPGPGAAPATATAAAATAPPPPIAPPPPPADAAAAPPPTIALGQKKDDVVANFGQPMRVVKLGTKEIDYYKDMKVTFVNGKVTDVQ